MTLEEKNPTKNKIAGVAIAFSGYYYGYTFPIFNSMATPMLSGYFGLPESEKDSIAGTLNFLFCFAAMFGVLSLGYFNTNFGRIKTAMGLDCSIIFVGIILQINNLYTIMFARLLSGYITGMYNMNAAVTLVELMPTELMGHCNMFLNILSGAFSLISFVQQIVLSQETLASHWSLMLVWPSFISIFRFGFYYSNFHTDTPVYIFNKFRNDSTLRARLKESLSMVYSDSNLDEYIENFITERSASELQSTSYLASNKELFTPKYLPKTIGCFLLKTAEALTGYPFLILFSTMFFEKLDMNGKLISLVLGIFNIVGPCVGMLIINRYSRKSLMVNGVYLQGGAFFGMWVGVLLGFVWPVAISLAFYMTAYAAAIGGINGMYIAEVLPSYAIGITIGAGWLLWSFIGKVSVSLSGLLGETRTLLFFAILCILFAELMKRYLIDLKGTTQASDRGETEQPLIELKNKEAQ
jgi:MFS family permease